MRITSSRIQAIIKIRFQLTVFIALILPLMLYSQAGYKVTGVDFKGNKTISSSRLKDNMVVYGTGTIKRLIFRKDPFLFNEQILKDDINRLTKFSGTM